MSLSLKPVSCRANGKQGIAMVLDAGEYDLTALDGRHGQLHMFADPTECDTAAAALRTTITALRRLRIPPRGRVRQMRDDDGRECWVVELHIPSHSDPVICVVRLLLVNEAKYCLTPRIFYDRREASAVASDIMDALMRGAINWAEVSDMDMIW
jgi:hypothetical protein